MVYFCPLSLLGLTVVEQIRESSIYNSPCISLFLILFELVQPFTLLINVISTAIIQIVCFLKINSIIKLGVSLFFAGSICMNDKERDEGSNRPTFWSQDLVSSQGDGFILTAIYLLTLNLCQVTFIPRLVFVYVRSRSF